MKPSFNLEAVDMATKVAMDRGDRILQTHWYANTDDGQASYLLAILDPPLNSVILDNGCGIGEICRIFAKKRPDLEFVMTNISSYQLGFCPDGMIICCDSHQLNLPSNCVDCVMLSCTLCQLDAEIALD